jgi:diguanylate cyclase (GGDEF)-like protein
MKTMEAPEDQTRTTGPTLPPIDQRILRDLRRRSIPGLFVFPLIVVIVSLTDNFYARRPELAVPFAVSMIGICLFRMLHMFIAPRLPAAYRSVNDGIFFVSIVLTGLLWGCWFTRLIFLTGEHEVQLLIAICTAGIGAGGTVSFIPNLRLSVTYNFCMFAPAVVAMSLYHVKLPLSVSLLLFSIFLVPLAFQFNREYWQALENERLLLEKSAELTRLSRIDVLTGLFNRRHFEERFTRAWKQMQRLGEPLTLIICDIDHFKQINDRFGHQVGDDFLKLTAELFMVVFRRETDLVARYGGEEFVILLVDIQPEAAVALAEAMRNHMAAASLTIDDTRVTATMSIGIASLIPGPDDTRDGLINRADMALYEAKQSGRNRTVVAPGSVSAG